MPNSFSFLNKQIHVECVKWRGKDSLRNFSRIDRKTTRFWSEHFWSKIPDTCKNSISRFQRSIIRAPLFTNIIIIGGNERIKKKKERNSIDLSSHERKKAGKITDDNDLQVENLVPRFAYRWRGQGRRWNKKRCSP